MVAADPARIEHERWPPSPGDLATVCRDGIGETDDVAAASVRLAQMTNVDMGLRDGGNANHVFSFGLGRSRTGV
jgi:hypothetical protein